MAPDLNSVPPSPRNPPPAGSQQTSTPTTAHSPGSRRTSQIYPMNPPPLPLASPGGTIPLSVQQSHQPFPPLSPVLTNVSNSGSEGGPSMPMRHPRPLTPAELYLELEKEQEAVVNRLTRELTALRAHSASVASTASSASTFDINGPSHPTSARRHRSSSSTSQTHGGSTLPAPHGHRPSGSAPAPAPTEPAASTPSAASRHASIGGGAATGIPLSARAEDLALHRLELDEAKRENERLRRRVRELEALVRGRRAGSAGGGAAAEGAERGGGGQTSGPEAAARDG